MSCSDCIPTLTVTSVTVDSSEGTATLTVPVLPTTPGRFNLNVRRCIRVNPCSTAKVVLTDGTNTIQNVLARCGNFLLLGQMACRVSRGLVFHFNRTYNPDGNALCLDALALPANAAPDAYCPCPTVTVS